MHMKNFTPVSKIIRTNCTVIEAEADIQSIRFIFEHFPNQFLPVVRGLRFIGVILRDEFFRDYNTNREDFASAADMVSKEMVMLSPDDNLSDAKEIFDTKVFDVIPVADEDGDLMGIVLREDVEIQLMKRENLVNPFAVLRRAFA